VPSFNYDFPYASKKLPIFADNVVATSQHLASTAGLRMLAKGGNAVDAALARYNGGGDPNYVANVRNHMGGA